HELLDSIVKEQLAKSFDSTEARILQHLWISSSLFSKNFFFLLNRLRFRKSLKLLVSGRRILQRFNSLSTFIPTRLSLSTQAPTGLNHHPVSPAHSTRI